jgi:hypothetical protein
LILIGIALALRAVVARWFEPILGAGPARSAALVAALLLPLHPAAPGAVAALAGRGEAVALGLGLSAGALFLRGRQEERDAWTGASFVLLVIAGCASSVAGLLGLLFAAAELTSVRRHRRRSLRLRTAGTTALVFCAGALLPLVVSSAGVRAAPSPRLPLAAALRESVLAMASELGGVATSPPGGLGALAVPLAGGLLLLALQPAVPAARSAPRLWGRILVSWSAVLLAALLWAHRGESARDLILLAVWSTGLGLSITALVRPRRALRAAVLAFGWAILAHATARPWLEGSRALARIGEEIRALAPLPDGRLLVLDPPVVTGLPPLAHNLGWTIRECLAGGADGPELDPRRVQGLSGAAFLAWTRTDAFERARAEGLVVLWRSRGPEGVEGTLRAVQLPAPGGEPARTSWRGDLKYTPDAPLDPLAIGCVRLVAELATPPRELEQLAWRTPAAEAARSGDSGSLRGFVSERGGRRVAEFDLEASLAWRLSGSVAALLVKNGVREIERGELLARAPEIPALASPEVVGSDWRFARPGLADAGAALVLGLLALHGLERLELPLEPDPAGPVGALRARGAQRFVTSHARPGAPVAWELEYRVGPHVLQRSRGTAP